MNEKTLKIAISSQKGGVGKSTCTILVAGVLHYLKNFNCAIVDGDAPQHSIHVLRQRDMEAVGQSDFLKVALYRQFERIHKKSYPIIRSTPVSAVEDLEKYQREHPEQHFDIVLFDLPGTLRSEGVIYTISQMDYVFVPLKADNIVMQSSLQFAEALDEELVQKHNCNLKGIHLFWNMLDRRERTDIYQRWNAVIREDNLRLMDTALPASARFNKELSAERNSIFRSTLFPPDTRQLRGSGVQELAGEICSIIDLK